MWEEEQRYRAKIRHSASGDLVTLDDTCHRHTGGGGIHPTNRTVWKMDGMTAAPAAGYMLERERVVFVDEIKNCWEL